MDTAAGLDPGDKRRAPDASCASVLEYDPAEVQNGLPKLRLVAQLHGWIPIPDYADEIKKLCVWYNTALCVIELTGGYGSAVMQRLRRKILYWNLFRAENRAELADQNMEARFGIDTNSSTKPIIVGNLQAAVLYDQIDIPCIDTINEMIAL